MSNNHTVHTIEYGPTYNTTVNELLGTIVNRFNKQAKIIDSCVHTGNGTMRAFETWLNKDTGTVIKIVKYGVAYDKVIVFANTAEYTDYTNSQRELERNPETLR